MIEPDNIKLAITFTALDLHSAQLKRRVPSYIWVCVCVYTFKIVSDFVTVKEKV